MLVEPMYYAVFFDENEPQTFDYAMTKRIDRKKFDVLAYDLLPQSTVELTPRPEKEGDTPKVYNYQIISTKTFNISNSVDNHFFVICIIKKPKT